MIYSVHFSNSEIRYSATLWFNSGASFAAGTYYIFCEGWYSKYTGIGEIDAWTNTPPPIDGMHIKYGATNVMVSSVAIGTILVITHLGGQIGLYMNDDVYGDNSANATYTLSDSMNIVSGRIFHYVDFLDSTTSYPLYNIQCDITLYYKNPESYLSSLIEYSYKYSSLYTNHQGSYYMDINTNPFSTIDLAYYSFAWRKLIGLPVWNWIKIDFTTCSSTNFIENAVEEGVIFMPHGYIEHILDQTITVKNSSTHLPVGTASISAYQSHRESSVQLTDIVLGTATFSVYPTPITYHIQKELYKIYTPIYDLSGSDTQDCTATQDSEIDPLPIVNSEHISFANTQGYGGYYPSDIIQMNYNVGVLPATGQYRSGSYIKLFNPNNILVYTSDLLDPPVKLYYSPPTLNFSPSTSLYGMFVAKLFTSENVEYANASVNFGSLGTLTADTSDICTTNILTVNFSGIFPLTTIPSKPLIKIYDGNDIQKGSTYEVNGASGSTTYEVLPTDDTDSMWYATLTDMWGHIVFRISFPLIGCDQVLYGSVKDIFGASIVGATITIDLTGLGYSIYTGTSDDNGNYMVVDFPPFTSQIVSCSLNGYATKEETVSITSGSIVRQDFILTPLLSGTVTDIEGNPIDHVMVFIDDLMLKYTNDQGKYFLPISSPATYTVNALKNNFDLNGKSVIISDLITPVIQNFILTRKTLETYDANPLISTLVNEMSGIMLDDLTHATLPSSGQQLVLADYTNSLKGLGISVLNTAQGIGEIEFAWGGNVLINDNITRIIQIGGTITLKRGYVIVLEDVNSIFSMAILKILHEGDLQEKWIVTPGIIYTGTYTNDGETDTISIRIESIFSGKEINAIFVDYIHQSIPGQSLISGDNFAQIFNSSFNFNEIDIPLAVGAGTNIETHTPLRISIELYDTTGYSVSGTNISFTTPIFKDTIVIPPNFGTRPYFYFTTQPPGTYCIKITNLDTGHDSNLYIYALTPSTYSYKAYGVSGAEVSYSIATFIREAPLENERYLIRQGATDESNFYIASAKTTNLVEIT